MCHAINSNWHLTSTSHSVPRDYYYCFKAHTVTSTKKSSSRITSHPLIRGSQNFQWPRSRFKIRGDKRMTWSAFHTRADTFSAPPYKIQPSGASWCPGFGHTYTSNTHRTELLGGKILCVKPWWLETRTVSRHPLVQAISPLAPPPV